MARRFSRLHRPQYHRDPSRSTDMVQVSGTASATVPHPRQRGDWNGDSDGDPDGGRFMAAAGAW